MVAGLEFVVRIDHEPLKHFFSQPNLSSRQLQWFNWMTEFLPGLKILYQQGKDNLIPNTLSRQPDYLAALPTTPTMSYSGQYTNILGINSFLLTQIAQ